MLLLLLLLLLLLQTLMPQDHEMRRHRYHLRANDCSSHTPCASYNCALYWAAQRRRN